MITPTTLWRPTFVPVSHFFISAFSGLDGYTVYSFCGIFMHVCEAVCVHLYVHLSCMHIIT